MKIQFGFIGCLLFIGMTDSLGAEVMEWRFTADGSQVKNNASSPDGSTGSSATGSGWFRYDTSTNIMSYSITWDNLFGELTKLHVHGPAGPDVSNPQHVIEIFGPPDIPAEVDLRSYTLTDSYELDTLVQPNFAPLTPAEILSIMESGQSYINYHTNVFGVGEIRGNLGVPVPEPSSLSLLALAAFGVFATRRIVSKALVGPALLAIVLTIWLSNRSSALDIIWEPLSASTHPDNPAGNFDEEPPANDPNSLGLLNILQEVEDVFEGVFEDPATIRITYWWDDDMGFCCGQSIPSWIEENNGTLTHSVIRFDSNSAFFIDPTPENDSEYDMDQVLYNFGPNSLSPAQQIARFAGSVPNLFEAGYNGNVITGGAADGAGLDLLTLAFQEVGHSLGMNAGFSGVTNGNNTGEVDDGDYDVNPNFLRGNVMNMAPRGANPDPLDHLLGNDTVMGNLSIGSERTRPSAADFFAIAATQNWTDIDLPRTDFLGGTDWGTDFNWTGGAEPLSDDIVYIRHGGDVDLDPLGNVEMLTIDNQSSLDTGTGTLIADELFIQSTVGGGTPRLIVNNFGDLISERTTIDNGARLDLLGGDAEIINRLFIRAGGELRGYGTVNLSDQFATLTNDGLIQATAGNVLEITSPNNLALDLDGEDEDGEVEAINGDIRFTAGTSEVINDRITVGAGRFIEFGSSFSVGGGGLVLLAGTDNAPADIQGAGIFFVNSSGVVRADGRGDVNNTIVLEGIAETQDSNSELRLDGSTFLQGGTILGTGTARQNGNVFVTEDTAVAINTYDLDGVTGNTIISISEGKTLEINSPNIDTTVNQNFGGTINVDSGVLDMLPNWNLDGVINLTRTASGLPTLSGTGTLTILEDGGQLNIVAEDNNTADADINHQLIVEGGIFSDGNADFSESVAIASTATLEADDPGDELDFNGNVTLGGGSYVGGGAIKFDNQVFVVQSTSIGIATTDLDGDNGSSVININPNVTFSVNSSSLEIVPNDGFDGEMNLEGEFASLVTFRLDGTLTMDEFQGAALPTLSGGSFAIHTTGDLNVIGDALVNRNTAVSGDIDIQSGTTQINGTATFESTANVTIADGAKLELNAAPILRGGSYTGAGLMEFNALTVVEANTTIDLERVDLDGAADGTQINVDDSRFILNVTRIDGNSNIFSGTMNVIGTGARLEVNLSSPTQSWRLQSNGELNFTNPGPGGSIVMIDGNDLGADGIINATGRVTLGVNVDVRNRLNALTLDTDVHFAGGDRSYIRQNVAATVAGSGSITVDNGSILSLEGSSQVAVSTENNGRLEVGFLFSEVSVDTTYAGEATIRGNYSQGSNGQFAVDLGGMIQSTEYDLLTVIGTARLNGDIEATLIDGFVPEIGDTFQVLTATQVVGQFDTVSVVDEAGVLSMELTAIYSSVDVVLQVDDVFLIGDYNDDGQVDLADYTVWRNNLGAPAGTLPNDSVGGVIDADQYAVWRANFGAVLPAAAFRNANVPEPNTFVLLSLLALATAIRYRLTTH